MCALAEYLIESPLREEMVHRLWDTVPQFQGLEVGPVHGTKRLLADILLD